MLRAWAEACLPLVRDQELTVQEWAVGVFAQLMLAPLAAGAPRCARLPASVLDLLGGVNKPLKPHLHAACRRRGANRWDCLQGWPSPSPSSSARSIDRPRSLWQTAELRPTSPRKWPKTTRGCSRLCGGSWRRWPILNRQGLITRFWRRQTSVAAMQSCCSHSTRWGRSRPTWPLRPHWSCSLEH